MVFLDHKIFLFLFLVFSENDYFLVFLNWLTCYPFSQRRRAGRGRSHRRGCWRWRRWRGRRSRRSRWPRHCSRPPWRRRRRFSVRFKKKCSDGGLWSGINITFTLSSLKLYQFPVDNFLVQIFSCLSSFRNLRALIFSETLPIEVALNLSWSYKLRT